MEQRALCSSHTVFFMVLFRECRREEAAALLALKVWAQNEILMVCSPGQKVRKFQLSRNCSQTQVSKHLVFIMLY